eukprot:SAG11_NODE_33772_length_275_cov_0.960227_1_plen_49_part_10
MFLLILFAIGGVQWFGGEFHNRCVDPVTNAVIHEPPWEDYMADADLCGN